MSSHDTSVRRKTIRSIINLKQDRPVVCLTAYTAPMARIVDRYADLILVGDSLGMVVYGLESTVGVSLDMMVNHGAAVMRATNKALVVVDMPFGSYQESKEQAFRNAAHILKMTGAAAVKIEGGEEIADTISFLSSRGIPVMGHIGLQPQSVNSYGGYLVRGRDEADRIQLQKDANLVAEAGAFSVVIECVTPSIAGEITAELDVPVIGIGAGHMCDGQILVTEDMLGLTGQISPKFVKPFADLTPEIEHAIENYAQEVKDSCFPDDQYSYTEDITGKKFKILK